MLRLTIAISFDSQGIGNKTFTRSIDCHDDLDLAGWEYLSGHMFRECQMEILYRSHRLQLPSFEGFSEASDWSPSQSAISNLTRWAAETNTAEAWLQIQNAFLETAHLLAQSRAYKDLEDNEEDKDKQFLMHLVKMQFFNSAVFHISKMEDLFLQLLFVNSGCSLLPNVDVHSENWSKEIKRGEMYKGLKLRRSQLCCGRFRRSNPYLDALADEEYRTIRSVFKKLGSSHSVRTIRNYRNAIAHRGLPAVDRPEFSPAFRFPKKHGLSESLGLGGKATVEYSFLEIYQHAVAALTHCETQLRKVKAIPVLK